MLKKIPYQEEAVADLLRKSYRILNLKRPQTKLVFKSPTGSGKTVMMGQFLSRFMQEYAQEAGLSDSRFAFIWIAPNSLHAQSYRSMQRFFEESRLIEPIGFEGISDGYIREGQMVFFNWQSITGDNRIFVNENESGQFLESYLNNTRSKGIRLIVILDEAHLFATRGNKANLLLKLLNADMEIDVSATPLFVSDYSVVIDREEVVKAQMIKKALILNPALESSKQDDAFNIYLLNQALARRDDLARRYSDLGIKINPLLLIQLPNDTAKDTDEDRKIKNLVRAHLSEVKGIRADNGRLGMWLSKEEDKKNLTGIEKPNNGVEVLLFKQAIALGWDCPRAAVLLIYREISKAEFGVQTVGRILRMPQQKHYSDDVLNYGYVYTNLARSLITIKQEIMYDLVENKSYRDNERYNAIALEATTIKASPYKNDLKVAFYRVFESVLVDYWGLSKDLGTTGTSFFERNAAALKTRMIDLSLQNLELNVLINQQFEGRAGEIIQAAQNDEHFQLYMAEINDLFQAFCFRLCGDFNKKNSVGMIHRCLTEILFQNYLGMFETEAKKVVLRHPEPFLDLMNTALLRYQQEVEKARKEWKQSAEVRVWEVPEIMVFNEKYLAWANQKSIMKPQYLYNRGLGQLADSTTEFAFLEFLESGKNLGFIDWWHKNGSDSDNHFAIPYMNQKGFLSLFYVDFVVRFNSGSIGLFDPKTPESDKEMVAKHNALNEYVKAKSTPEKPLIGSIVMFKNESWMYCTGSIQNGWDLTAPGWGIMDLNKF